jgi:hypothetical protein
LKQAAVSPPSTFTRTFGNRPFSTNGRVFACSGVADPQITPEPICVVPLLTCSSVAAPSICQEVAEGHGGAATEQHRAEGSRRPRPVGIAAARQL